MPICTASLASTMRLREPESLHDSMGLASRKMNGASSAMVGGNSTMGCDIGYSPPFGLNPRFLALACRRKLSVTQVWLGDSATCL